MSRRTHAAVLVTMVAGTLYPLPALADMYVWTDNAGVTHISNLAPPEGTQMVSITRTAARDPAQDAALREAARQAELRALNEQVQQLQAEVEQARREPPQAIVMPQQPQHAPAPSAPYVIVVAPPPAPAYPQPVVGCDSAWGNCGFGFWPGFYPASIVVVRDRHFRHHHPIHHAHPRHFGHHAHPRHFGPHAPPAIQPLHPVRRPGPK